MRLTGFSKKYFCRAFRFANFYFPFSFFSAMLL